ncbi:MAG: hypothetical protein ABI868_23360 [Acidobacteriota bacterium]
MSGNETTDYCRRIETYLCRKNDGHLIRVVGPSFDLVAGWEAQGVPLDVALSGIDRCLERHRRKGPRRRPIKIDFCAADVLDAFDQWRRAVGLPPPADEASSDSAADPDRSRRASLPAHLERVVMRLSAARANGRIGGEFDDLIDAAARELDLAQSVASGLRGAARHALIARLAALDAEILQAARAALDEPARATLMNDADQDLAAFRDRMASDVFVRARDAAFDRRVRDRFGLPIVAFLTAPRC